MAVAISGAVIAPTAAQADSPSGLPGGVESAAHGHGIWVDGIGIPVVETTNARSAFNGAPWATSQRATLDPALLDAITLNLSGVRLPLMKNATHANGVLDLGSYGDTEVLIGTADSGSDTSSAGSAGVAGQGGSTVILNPSQVPAGFRPAKLDLAALLRQLVGNASAGVLDTGTLEIGAVGAKATKTNGVLKREYMVAGADLRLHSQSVAGVSNGLRGALNGVGGTLNAAVGTNGVLGKVVGGLPKLTVPGVLTADLSGGTIAIDDLQAALDAVHAELIGTPLKDPNNIVNIDLSNGSIAIDLSKVVDGGDLNGLDPNTALLSAPVLNEITLAVEKALGTVTTKAVAAIKAAVNNLGVTINVKAKLKAIGGLVSADANIQVKAKLGQLTGDLPGTPSVTVTQLAGGGLLGALLSLLGLDLAGLTTALTQPLLSALLTGLKPVVGTLLNTIGTDLSATLNGVTSPVITALSPVLQDFGTILAITINEQPDLRGTPTPGDLGAGSRTVRALSVRLLPAADAANIELASATALAADPVVAGPQLTGTTAPQGGVVHLNGSGFDPGEAVTLALPGGGTDTKTADGDGKFTYDWSVPETQTAPGTVDFAATGASSGSADATVSISLPGATLTAPATAKQGETITITGSGFASTEQVTVTMPDGTSTHPTAVGGNITTTWTIPEDQVPGPVTFGAKGDDSKRIGKTGTGTSSGETAISTADAALNATDAKQGGLVHLTGSGFIAGEDVVIDLPGAPGTKTVQASGSGDIVFDWRVPSSQPTNNSTPYSAEGQTSGRTAEAVAKVGAGPWITIVPSPAQPGDTVTVTGDGFDPAEDVTVDGPGTDCARAVTADGSGHFQYDCTIPANQTPGTVVVTATGGNGNTSETDLDIILVTLSATGPVKPGETVTLSGDGFVNGESVAIAVPGGTVSATASGTGTVSATWV
ncbi:MAG: choice-of-anchor G family protein, partial [Actinobacteria bacterium]|nr:choice-of-anchor G family protein [Actinomycetota bacterium]